MMGVNEDIRKTEALGAILLAHRPRLLAFLQAIGARDEAEDLLQEAWIKVSALGDFLPDEPLSYLFRLLHNLLLDRRRGDGRAVRREAQWAQVHAGDLAAISDDPGEERRLIGRQELLSAARAIDALGEPTASIFRRHRIDGVTQRVIATEFAMGLSTVEKHLRKAYRALLLLRGTGDEA